MKQLFILAIIFIAFSCNGWQEKKTDPTKATVAELDKKYLVSEPVQAPAPIEDTFHIKIVPYGRPWGGTQLWCIHFTNDNWKTVEDIRIYNGDYTTSLFNKQEAIDFANDLTSYAKCYSNNRREQIKSRAPLPKEINVK